MKHFFQIGLFLTVLSLPVDAVAQNKYDVFVGDWVAAVLISNTCSGMMVSHKQEAAQIARTQEGLRKQKVLKRLYYGKTVILEQLGNAALAGRDVDPSNKNSLCRFGRSVAGKNDRIGRFLYVN